MSEKEQPVWIRHVLVPTVSDDEEDLINLGMFIRELNNVEKVEILPYHELGVYKWEQLGLSYPLKHILPPTEEMIERAKRLLAI